MFRETSKSDDAVVGLICEGDLSNSDLRQIHELLHERLAVNPNSGLLIHMKNFTGYKNLSAVAKDLKMDVSHRNDFSRIAVVGDCKWMRWGTALAQSLTSAKMQWFDTDEIDQATAWAREGYERPKSTAG
jgi:hypothetical protein